MNICGIHQPNYFPWIGYWIKLASSTDFVLFDSCPLDEQGYSRRVKIKPVKGSSFWCSQELMPHKHGSSLQFVKANLSTRNKRILLAQLKSAYGKLAYGSEMLDFVTEQMNSFHNQTSIAKLNTQLIQHLAKLLAPQTKISLASEITNYVSGQTMLIKLCKSKNADTYLSGSGALSYLNTSEFTENQLVVKVINFGNVAKKLFHEDEINQSILGLYAKYGLFELRNRLDISCTLTHNSTGV